MLTPEQQISLNALAQAFQILAQAHLVQAQGAQPAPPPPQPPQEPAESV